MKLLGSHLFLLLTLSQEAYSYQQSSSTEMLDAVVSAYLIERDHTQEHVLARFQSWAIEHLKEYKNTDEAWRRMEIWMHNDALLQQHPTTTSTSTYELGHNQFSDLTQNEFHALFNLGKYRSIGSHKNIPIIDHSQTATKISRSLRQHSNLDLPDYVNWVDIGAVTPVKNQGACGACWAFSTTGALEGAKFVKTGELVALSEQNLLDCDHIDMGCSGGLMDNAFKFDEKTGGLCSEDDYPYMAVQDTVCHTDCTDVDGTIVKTFVDVPSGDERALLSAVAMQPISVAIQADQFAFQFYRRGVLNDESCGKDAQIDHGVLAVGYGTDLDTQIPYWLVKNSWGEPWGEAGYFRLARNSTNEFGMCAILKMSSFPVLE